LLPLFTVFFLLSAPRTVAFVFFVPLAPCFLFYWLMLMCCRRLFVRFDLGPFSPYPLFFPSAPPEDVPRFTPEPTFFLRLSFPSPPLYEFTCTSTGCLIPSFFFLGPFQTRFGTVFLFSSRNSSMCLPPLCFSLYSPPPSPPVPLVPSFSSL